MGTNSKLYEELREVCEEANILYSKALGALVDLNFDVKIKYQEMSSEMLERHQKEREDLECQRNEHLNEHCNTVILWVAQGKL